jgi:hypothetical protein
VFGAANTGWFSALNASACNCIVHHPAPNRSARLARAPEAPR